LGKNAEMRHLENKEARMESNGHPVLYVGEESESRVALSLLKNAGFCVEVKAAPGFYEAAYGTPVLFALSNRFEGIDGIRVFIKNAEILGYPRSL
jgi:hypothetical protein